MSPPNKVMLLLKLAVLASCISSGLPQPPKVDTPLGPVIGKTVYFRSIPVNTFQSIPYAKPPINDLRFKKTQPVDKWTNPILANHLPPACPQYSTVPFLILDTLPGQTIDCLYLNIWVPKFGVPFFKRRVMLYVHGGGFRIGSSRLDVFNGKVLAALGDVIVITFNYRLGPEGFLYFGTKDAPGNMGLYDILEALKWTRANIESFGGDKDKITLFGQSSGAIAISMFLTSPLAQNLFFRAILESGSAANLDADDNNRDFLISKAIADDVGCSSKNNNTAETVACLRTLDAINLTKTAGRVSTVGLYPRYGDEILPWNPRIALIGGFFKSKNILIGTNKNEGSRLVTRTFLNVFGFFGHRLNHINKTFGENIIRKALKEFNHTDAVIQHYLNRTNINVLQQVQSALGDYETVCPSVYLAESVAAKGSRVHYYELTQRSSNTPYAAWMGVPHSDEIPFVFGYPLRYYRNYSMFDNILSRRMVSIWTTFAKTGYPFQPWPNYSRKNHKYRKLNTTDMRIGIGPHEENCEFFRPYFGF